MNALKKSTEEKTKIKIGCHVSNKGLEMLKGAACEMEEVGANCFMVYLGAPQNTIRKQPSEQRSVEMEEKLKELGVDVKDCIVHAPYIVNLAQSDDVKFHFAVDFLVNEIMTAYYCGFKYLVLHPGAHVGKGVEYGIRRISEGLKLILKRTEMTDIVICLETMAGKGTEIGSTFEELKTIIDLVESDRIKVCLDTCHIHDAGYDIVNNYARVIKEFDKIINIKNIKVIHLNDSKNECGSRKDRHENIGYGKIGFKTLLKVFNDKRFITIPKILETPFYKDEEAKVEYEPYKDEIIMLKNGKFNDHLIEDIILTAMQ